MCELWWPACSFFKCSSNSSQISQDIQSKDELSFKEAREQFLSRGARRYVSYTSLLKKSVVWMDCSPRPEPIQGEGHEPASSLEEVNSQNVVVFARVKGKNLTPLPPTTTTITTIKDHKAGGIWGIRLIIPQLYSLELFWAFSALPFIKVKETCSNLWPNAEFPPTRRPPSQIPRSPLCIPLYRCVHCNPSVELPKCLS